VIQFFAAGTPSGQGSKTYMGKGIMIDTNKNLKSWRSVIACACPMDAPLSCLIGIELVFYFSRPQSHYGRRDKKPYLKGNAPIYKPSKPDADKLARAALDALTGIAYVDDAMVVKLTVHKCYTHATTGVQVTITPLSEP